MRTKREFYNQINDATKTGLKTLQELSDQVAKVNEEIRSGKYSDEYTHSLISQRDTLRRQIEEARAKANGKVKSICDEYTEELRAQEDLDPSLITDDIKLLQAGVKLKRRDITAMLKRNADNHTMTQMILRYAQDNDIETGVNYIGNRPVIDSVAMVPSVVETALKWSDNQASVYDRLMGEGSDLETIFND